jgi:hypothetical protein
LGSNFSRFLVESGGGNEQQQGPQSDLRHTRPASYPKVSAPATES